MSSANLLTHSAREMKVPRATTHAVKTIRLVLLASLIALCPLTNASTIDVTIDTSLLSGVSAILAFDFIDGGPPDNSVTLSPLTSDGTQSSTSTTGNVTGTGPWTFSDGSFFSELLVTFNPMGTTLSFSFTTTDKPPAGAVPDAFSVAVLDASATSPLVTTNDPTGASALFLFDIGQGFQGMTLYRVDQEGVSVSAEPAQPVPEPASAALLLAGAAALLVRRR